MIGIIGKGVVGTAVHYCLARFHDIIIHDPILGTALDELLEETNFAYICVPTPQSSTSREADISIIHEVLSQLPDGFQAVIKSTIPPGTTKILEEKYPKLRIAYSPEFLVERNAIQDYSKQDLLVVGTNDKELAETVFHHHISAQIVENSQCVMVDSTSAEILKYSRNLFYAIKVIFSNQMYDISRELGIDWSQVSELMTSTRHQLIGPSHLDPMHGDYRGFGGKCLPKDVAALAHLAKELGVEYQFIDAIMVDNLKLRNQLTNQD
jgi:UDPglucose 6-dehydrogenase|tara:strand:+ start:1983 stop:2780 length:798 start_codon:yes stop_codon:yes gene_type:complete